MLKINGLASKADGDIVFSATEGCVLKFLSVLFVFLLVQPAPVGAGILDRIFGPDEWVGYVIKVTDYAIYEGSDRRKRMIFPSNATYQSKDDCYYYFQKKFAGEPLKSRYPQTSDPYSSYIFGCVKK